MGGFDAGVISIGQQSSFVIVKLMNRKGFAPVVILLIVVGVLVIGAAWYLIDNFHLGFSLVGLWERNIVADYTV